MPRDATFVATSEKEKESFIERIHNIEEHEKYRELQDTNLKQEIAIKHLRSELVDLKVELNHQINLLEIKLKDANVKRELKEHEAENLLSKVTGIKTQMHSLTKDIEHERAENVKLKAESAKLTKLNEELHAKIKEQSCKVSSLESNIQQIKSDRESALSEVKVLQQKLTAKERTTNEQKQINTDIRQDLVQANCKVEELSKENKKLTSKVNEFEKEIFDLKIKLQRLETEKQKGRMKSSVVPTWR